MFQPLAQRIYTFTASGFRPGGWTHSVVKVLCAVSVLFLLSIAIINAVSTYVNMILEYIVQPAHLGVDKVLLPDIISCVRRRNHERKN